MRQAIALFCGVLFGIGLVMSDMINPARVTGFLDFAGRWDPATLFVFAGALIASGLVQLIALKRGRPLFDTRFHLTEKTRIDRPLVIGALVFGLGWGLSGLCPGPALAALSQPSGDILLFLAAMFAGFAIYRFMPGRQM